MDHEYLQFAGNNARVYQKKARKLWERRTQFGVPRRLHTSTIRSLHQDRRLAAMLPPPMHRLLRINRPIYRELTIEFYSTYSYDAPQPGADHDFTQVPAVRFRLGGVWRVMTVSRLGVLLGIYNEHDAEAEDYPQDYTFPSAEVRAEFWDSIADDAEPFNPHSSKATRIRDPLLRVLQKVFAHTICGRKDSTGKVATPDLLYLYAIDQQAPINLGARMAEFFLSASGTRSGSEIHGGEYVTQIAHRLGLLDDDDVVASLTFVTDGLWIKREDLERMNLITDTPAGIRLRGLDNRIWDPLPVDPQQQPQQQPQHEQQPLQPLPLAQYMPYHEHQHQYQHQFHQHDQPPPPPPHGLPPYPVIYQQFEQLCLNTERVRDEARMRDEEIRHDLRRRDEEIYAEMRRRDDRYYEELQSGFSSLFSGLHQMDPTAFPHATWPFEYPGDKRSRPDQSGPSGSRQGDDEE